MKPRKRSVDNLSVQELRQILIQKQRAERLSRVDQYRRTGRVIRFAAQPFPTSLDSLSSSVVSEEEPPAETRRTRPKGLDRALFVVEIAAVIGLVFVLVNIVNVLRGLNNEVASLLQQPTLTPTPLINAVVLPSGHTPPDGTEPVRFNEGEIPEHLRPLVQSMAALPIPTPGPEYAVRLQIPAIDVDAPIVQGDGWEQLKKGVGQNLSHPVQPGQPGNLVLSGRNDIFGEVFRHLDQLKEGDEVIVHTGQRTYTYVVQETRIVEPDQVEVMAPTADPVVTLISCYPYLVDNQRIVVRAILKP